MKALLTPLIPFVLLALSWPAPAQVPSSPAIPTHTDSGPPDGIVFYNGRPFLIRNGRATLIDATLVPEGQILTHGGRLVPLPGNYGGFVQGTVQPGAVPTPQGTIGVAPQPGADIRIVIPGKTGAGATGVPGVFDPKNPGAGVTTNDPNTRTTGGGTTGATTKSAVGNPPSSR